MQGSPSQSVWAQGPPGMCDDEKNDSVGLGSCGESALCLLPLRLVCWEEGHTLSGTLVSSGQKGAETRENHPKVGATFLISIHLSLIIVILLDKDIQDSYCLGSVFGSTHIIQPDKRRSDQRPESFESYHEAKFYSFCFFPLNDT